MTTSEKAKRIFAKTIVDAINYAPWLEDSQEAIACFRRAYLMGVGAGVVYSEKPDGISQETWDTMVAKMEETHGKQE